MLPEAASRAGNIPYVGHREPVPAVIVAWTVIEFQPALRHRYRRFVATGSLIVDIADALTGTVHVARPGVRSIHLKAALKAAIQAPLQGVIGRIPFAGAN